MPEAVVVARVPVRHSMEAEFVGRVEPAPAPARAGPKEALLGALDLLDIVLAAALQRVFTAIKA
ncbi:MAG: hypothetical protein AVDCRST_MAG31-1853 [uncultured Sphingomonas sp.]|uniref:Uncharacterized protein n=1 Tax=uncultured Sphingomonas sp. TaxID=158754 RepID=A0A6J4TKS0_9SPHN|nr:hypothetical protein [uncultured Sphingomonas sp.]CAA9525023.1 MAG: hypothetical protein AVDCRST_MAG31-1853 [uncultured Sphingomonas sp.]